MSENVRQLKDYAREKVEECRKQRSVDAINNARRGFASLASMQYTEDDVEKIASKLKSKGATNVGDLTDLMYALNEHEDHITAFFKINGALSGLIKELTGNNASKQLFATGCVCNLAFGNSTNLSLSKASGAYLITYLHQSQNKNLLELCTWALGNIIASSAKAANLLKNQGVVENLIPLLNNNNEDQVINGAAYALSHVLSSKWDILETSQIEQICKMIVTNEIKSNQMLWLLYLLSDKEESHDIFVSNSVFKQIIECLKNTVLKNGTSDLLAVNCLIRIAANLCCKEIFADDSTWLYNDNLINTVNLLLTCKHSEIRKETMWLAGNIYNIAPDTSEKKIFFTNISDSLVKSCNDLK